MIGILDYGVGNLFSLKSSFEHIGKTAFVSNDPSELKKADRYILPGVGAFNQSAEKLRSKGLDKFVFDIVKTGLPLCGICLGMQLLFTRSFEDGEFKGLDIIKGDIAPLKEDCGTLKVPHIGWNALKIKQQSPLLKGIDNGSFVYFVHSYYAKTAAENIIATAEYGVQVPAVVQKGNVYACQFHPEKSGEVGLQILKNFAAL